MSMVGVPLLGFFGYLLNNKSPMIEISTDKPTAGKGCYMAAVLYMVTFLLCLAYTSVKKRAAKAREVQAKPAAGQYIEDAVMQHARASQDLSARNPLEVRAALEVV
eukprot:CAMPEP_0117563070 /NCGR_PEP_ID=MMETSP0784-20121206/55300_1 /TAXON_ID=39447 /ORGANISM="" /LENGTH=105 /DNA_ID=CAMNT_0005360695 /DNA_START=22 /DNA_END=336 /DNA_ORIENTATION=+